MRRLTPGPRAVGAAFGVPLAVVPLLGAALLGTVMPWQRILRDLPGATAPDYASRFGNDFVPLREGFVRQVLGAEFSAASERGTGRERALIGDSDDPGFDVPLDSGRILSPPSPGDPGPVEPWRSQSPSVAADGSVVAYQSTDTRIEGMGSETCAASPPGPTTVSVIWKYSRYPTETAGPCVQVVVEDLRKDVTTIASVGQSGAVANSPVHTFMLSGNGRYLVFATAASNIVPGDTNDATDIFVRDLVAKRTELISVSIHGGPLRRPWQNYPEQLGLPVDREMPDVLASISAETGTISHDGRYVLFESSADDLVPGDTPQSMDVFVRDRTKGTTERVSLSARGEAARRQDIHQDNNDRLRRFQVESAFPCMSPNGRYVAFRSWGSNLVPDDRNGGPDIFLRDRVTNRTELVTVSSSGMQQNREARPATGRILSNPQGYALKNCISDDGRYVLFEADSTNLVNDDTNGQWDVFLRDRKTATTRRVNVAVDGSETKAESEYWIGVGPPPAAEGAVLSPNGQFIIFQSFAKLDPADPDPSPENIYPGAEEYDLFVYEIARRRLTRLGGVRAYAATDQDGSGRVGSPALTTDASLVAFHVTRGYQIDLVHSVHIYRWGKS